MLWGFSCCKPPRTVDEAVRVMGVGVTLGILAIVALLVGLLLPSSLDAALLDALKDATMLDSRESRAYAVFANNSEYPIGLEVFVLNLTNPQEVLEGEKPKLEEIGPFVYKEYRIAHDVDWSDDYTTISYKYYTTYQFDEEASPAGSDMQMITQWNPVVYGVYSSSKAIPMLADVLKQAFTLPEYESDMAKAFMTRPIREYIFGYPDDPIFTMLHQILPGSFSSNYTGLVHNFTSMEDFALNAKSDAMQTGYPDIANLRQVMTYQDSITVCPASSIPISGTDGGGFPRPVKKTDRPQLFAASFYRNIDLKFVRETTVRGVKTLRFTLPEDMWYNTPENQEDYQQYLNGVINVTSCVNNVPMAVTRPRFANGANPATDFTAPEFTSQSEVTWLTDNKSPIETYFDVEPITGGSMNISSASQLTAQFDMIKLGNDTYLSNIARNYAPIFWARQFVEIGEDDAASFRNNVYAMMDAENAIFISGIAIGVLLGLIAGFLAAWGYRYYYAFKYDPAILSEFDSVHTNYANVGDDKGPEPVNLDYSTSFARQPGHPTYGTVIVKNPNTGETMPLPEAQPASYAGSSATNL